MLALAHLTITDKILEEILGEKVGQWTRSTGNDRAARREDGGEEKGRKEEKKKSGRKKRARQPHYARQFPTGDWSGGTGAEDSYWWGTAHRSFAEPITRGGLEPHLYI